MKRILLLFLLLAPLSCFAEPEKVVYLISPPRSLSVAFMRMIEARGDFSIYHEPSLVPYVYAQSLSPSVDWGKTGGFDWLHGEGVESFDKVKRAIFSETSNVFVKEISFHLEPFLDDELIQKENVYFVFLLRNPHHSILSFYNRLGFIPPDFDAAVGYKAAHTIFQRVVALGARPPLILLSEEVASHPETAQQQFCDYVGVPFQEEALSWNDLGTEFQGQREWHEVKRNERTHHWHADAIHSTGFRPLRQYEVDPFGQPTFSEVEDPHHRQACLQAYVDHLPYYLIFKEMKQL